jgi:uncharacterized phiE125 gp8 family phage protein
MRLVLVDGPAVEPLTAAEARARLNIGAEVTDDVLNAYIMAARQKIDGVDGYLGRALIRSGSAIWIIFRHAMTARIYSAAAASGSQSGYLDSAGIRCWRLVTIRW